MAQDSHDMSSMMGHKSPYASNNKKVSASAAFGKTMGGSTRNMGKKSTKMSKSKSMTKTGHMGRKL